MTVCGDRVRHDISAMESDYKKILAMHVKQTGRGNHFVMRYTKNKVSQIFLQYKSNNRETFKTAHIPGRKRRSTSTESEFSA